MRHQCQVVFVDSISHWDEANEVCGPSRVDVFRAFYTNQADAACPKGENTMLQLGMPR
jgi:hypothetical protein